MTNAQPIVLIVDDDTLLRTAFARALERVGYQVVQTTGSPAIVDLVRTHGPSLVLLDNHMPGTSGVELIGMLRAEWDLEQLPIVLISGSSVQGEIDAAMRAGANDFRRKPVELPDLIEAVEAVTRSSATTRKFEVLP